MKKDLHALKSINSMGYACRGRNHADQLKDLHGYLHALFSMVTITYASHVEHADKKHYFTGPSNMKGHLEKIKKGKGTRKDTQKICMLYMNWLSVRYHCVNWFLRSAYPLHIWAKDRHGICIDLHAGRKPHVGELES